MDPFIREYKNEPILAKVISDVADFASDKSTPFSIIHFNIRSITKNMDEMIVFLNRFSSDFQIIVLSETFLVYDLDVLKIDGYTTLYNKGTINKNDGVIVYIKYNISYTYIIKNIGDIKTLEIITKLKNTDIMITAIYRSPSTCPKKFNVDLLNYIQTIGKSDLHIIMGDINIDLLTDSDFVEEYKNTLNSFGYESYINRYTRHKHVLTTFL